MGGIITDDNPQSGQRIMVRWNLTKYESPTNTNLSHIQRTKLSALFKKLDTDGNGTIDVDEFVTVSNDERQAQDKFRNANFHGFCRNRGRPEDGNDELDFAEFKKAIRLLEERGIFKGWKIVLAERRRMAQREFSSRRDSPVM